MVGNNNKIIFSFIGKKSLFLTFLVFSLTAIFIPIKAAALTNPTVHLSCPSSASGVITVTVDYSFLSGYYGRLVVEASSQQVRLLDIRFPQGGSGTQALVLDTTSWTDGVTQIKATAAYVDYPPNYTVDGPKDITTNNTPQITVTPPPGTLRGVAEFNVSYKFPSCFGAQGLFLIYKDANPTPAFYKSIPLSSGSPTEGDFQFSYDTSNWPDGSHNIKVFAAMGVCYDCQKKPNSNTQNIAIATGNLPIVKIISPSGRVKGVVDASISYDFPSTSYSQAATIALERQSLYGYAAIASKQVSLNPVSPTTGTWDFTFDVSGWADNDYTLRAKASYVSVGYDYMLITVANKAIEVLPSEQTPQDKATTVGEPINVATGNMFTSQTDILIPSREIPIELSRTYNSQDDFSGSFGYGWRSNFDITLTGQSGQPVIEADEKGVYTVYTKNPDGTYKPSSGKYSTLTKNPDGTYTILREHGRKLYFDSQGRLTKIEERNGNCITLLRAPNGTISEISDASDRRLLFTQDSQGRITQVKDPLNRVFNYEYDANGNLVKTINPLNQETFYQYDSLHNLIHQADANSHSLYFEYDSSDRAYYSWQDGINNEVTLSFDPANKTTTSTDSLGNITKYEYNEYGLVTKITNSPNNIQAFTWDDNLNKTSSTDQNGNTTLFTYDTRGNLLTVKDPLNSATAFTYEPNFNLVNSITDALGAITQYAYDTKGNLTQVKDALTNTTNYYYNVLGELIQVKDANNNITNFTYDTFGNLIQIVDALSNSTSFAYDILGNLARTTDAKNNPTQFTCDALNRLIQITYADNSKATRSYNSVGNLVASSDPNNQTTTYAYDAVNRLIQTADPQGNITQYAYDTEGNRTAITDANLNKTQYFYDSLNRLIKTIDPLGNQAIFNYDPVGNLISKTDANGNTVNYAYDVNNRLAQITYPDASTIAYAYDELGRRISINDSTGTTAYNYDALNRLMQVDGPQANDTISYAYDKLGNRIQMTDPDNSITNYTYDSLNRLISLTDPQGKTTSYSYDSLNNLTQMDYPNHTQANYAFDNLNRLISLTNKKGREPISSYAYDYNPSGMRTKVTLAEGDYILYSYDKLNRLNHEERYSRKKELIYSFTYAYDPLGNRLTQEADLQEEHFKIKGLPKKADLEYSYNPLNQLTQLKIYKIDKKSKPKLHNAIDYAYDQNGNLIQELTQDKESLLQETKTYTYDFENRLTQLKIIKSDEPKPRVFDFAYDGLGRRISQTITETEEGETEIQTKLYLYDGLNAIIERGQTNQTLATYNRGLSYGGGIGSIIDIKTKNEEDQEKQLYYHYDGLGSVTTLTDTHAKPKITYTYDAFGNTLKQTGSRKRNHYTFSTKEQDNSGLIYFGARYYEPRAGRWISKDPLGMVDGPNVYAYVNNNPVNLVDPWGLCVEKPKVGLSICPRYGNWGGLDWSGGTQVRAGEIGPDISPIDQMDAKFRIHDISGYIGFHFANSDLAYQYVNTSNVKLYRDLRSLPNDPKLWNPPAKDVLRANVYRAMAELYLLFIIEEEE